ncbi:DNA-3-methyladenine glycosylase [Chryseobacterium sp. H3056]|uniref:Putative 3-methyladenine DNA glycosylase n=1 Tax=Kaistella daneshvariae TaxID=2487074 RepID=A0A3N0X081_9FLAO|nr:DNA-3-methyladenine glycosylase [Kaistella daneshvariae]ROI10742.1 DNA-3-methyladenine glycosylase [Kaistella daneshvariae]
MARISKSYFQEKSAPELARELLGKTLVRRFPDGSEIRSKITETEAYFGTDDLASHASKGRTPRTELMFGAGGHVYVYLIYGKYWLLNIVTGNEDTPEAVLIRGLEAVNGPGRIGNFLELDKSFYGEDLETSERMWLEDSDLEGEIISGPRVGVDYAGEEWRLRPWRFILKTK